MTEILRIKDKFFTQLYSEEELAEIVCDCVDRVQKKVSGTDDLVLIGVLNGGIPLFNEIAFSLGPDVTVDYVKASSYGDDITSSGQVRLILDSTADVDGRTVLIVDDIIDSGRTVKYLCDHFRAKGASEVLTCSLFYKRNSFFPEPDIYGKEIGEQFIIGYGLDYAGRGRNIKKILKLSNNGA